MLNIPQNHAHRFSHLQVIAVKGIYKLWQNEWKLFNNNQKPYNFCSVLLLLQTKRLIYLTFFTVFMLQLYVQTLEKLFQVAFLLYILLFVPFFLFYPRKNPSQFPTKHQKKEGKKETKALRYYLFKC